MDETGKRLNDLALRKLQLASEFLTLSRQIESMLDSYRFNLSKTKAVIGLSATSAALIDNRDMEPSVRVNLEPGGTFSLVSSDASTHPEMKIDPSEQSAAAAAAPATRPFRPFGILEPLSAKAARRDVTKALALICETASTKYRLQELDEEYRKLKKSLLMTTAT